MSYARGLSPSGRRPADSRYSDAAADAYHSHRHNSAILPRSSHERVVPISTQTYVDSVPSGSSRAGRSDSSGYDSYTGRRRRSSLLDGSRASVPLSIRSRPAILHDDAGRTMSPARGDREYYIVPASSKDARGAKKVYSMDNGGARLISETDILPDGTVAGHHTHHKHHRRTDSEDKSYRHPDRSSKTYTSSSRRDKTIDDEGAFSYTDPAGMYRDTQPSWREGDPRPRRGSLDRTGASRERSMSNADAIGSRRSREIGPPPSQRGWDKINDGMSRTKSLREGPREVSRSPLRGRNNDTYSDSRDSYYVAPRRESRDRSKASYHDRRDQYDSYDRDPKRDDAARERRLSAPKRKDRSVSRRGFGIRSDSQDRRAQRHSDDSLDSFGQDEPAYDRRLDVASDTEYTGKHHRTYRDSESRRDRGYDEADRDARSHKNRDRGEDRERHRRDESRDLPADSSQGSGAKLAAAGATAAATYGLLNARDANGSHERKRSTDETRTRRDDDSDRRRSTRLDDTSRRDDDSDRRRNSRLEDSSRRDDRHADPDRGLGFAFEAPQASSDRSRPDGSAQDTSRDQSRDNYRKLERTHEDVPPALQDGAAIDPDEEYRRRFQQAQRELGLDAGQVPSQAVEDADRERRRREREYRMQQRRDHFSNDDAVAGATSRDRSPLHSSFDSTAPESSAGTTSVVGGRPDMHRRGSIMDDPMPAETPVQILDNSLSDKRENRVRIVDPPTEEEEKKPKGILKRPTQKFPEDPNAMREGVAPLKESTKKGIPPGARWTKIDRRLVNPEALEDAKERYEERLDCVIVLRVLTKEEIQKLADRTSAIRDKRFEAEGRAEKRSSRRYDRERDRRDRDEYSDDGLEDWERDEKRPPRMLEAPPPASDHSDRR